MTVGLWVAGSGDRLGDIVGPQVSFHGSVGEFWSPIGDEEVGDSKAANDFFPLNLLILAPVY